MEAHGIAGYTDRYILSPIEHERMVEIEKEYLEAMSTRPEEWAECWGLQFYILPTVHTPDNDLNELICALPLTPSSKMLDMGTGSGASAILAAKFFGCHVLGIDINPAAVESAKESAKLNDVVDLVTFVNANLYGSLNADTNKFDVIFWNHPYGIGVPNSLFEKNFYDEDYKDLALYLERGKKYLAKGGQFVVSNSAQIGNRALFLERVRESGLLCSELISLPKMSLSRQLGVPVSRELFCLSEPWYLEWHQREDFVNKPFSLYCDMCGDLWHYGHALFLKEAKKMAAEKLNTSIASVQLVVGLFTDKEIRKYKRAPLLNLQERITSALACHYVDRVCTGIPVVTTKKFMDYFQFNLAAHGDDFKSEALNKYYGELMKEDRFLLVPYTPERTQISTTQLIGRLKEFINRQDSEEATADAKQ